MLHNIFYSADVTMRLIENLVPIMYQEFYFPKVSYLLHIVVHEHERNQFNKESYFNTISLVTLSKKLAGNNYFVSKLFYIQLLKNCSETA